MLALKGSQNVAGADWNFPEMNRPLKRAPTRSPIFCRSPLQRAKKRIRNPLSARTPEDDQAGVSYPLFQGCMTTGRRHPSATGCAPSVPWKREYGGAAGFRTPSRSCNQIIALKGYGLCASRLARNSVPSFQFGQSSPLAISRPVLKNTSMSSMAPSTFQLRSYSSDTR